MGVLFINRELESATLLNVTLLQSKNVGVAYLEWAWLT